jgi:hypothetical protein
LAGSVDDGVVGVEDAVREPVAAQVLPEVLDGVQLGGARWQEDRRDIRGDVEFSRCVPPGSIQEQHGVGALCDVAADLVEMKLHGLCVDVRQSERGAGAAGRTDGAEQVGALVALIGGLTRSRAAPCPLPDQAVLLADPGFVLEPDLDRRGGRHTGQVRLQGAWKVFLNASTIFASCAG